MLVPVAPTSEGSFAASDGCTLHYEAGGDASAVLYLLHGFCESAETVHVQRMARAATRAGWRLVVLEHVGHGLSSGPRAVVADFSQLVRHAHEFVLSRGGAGPIALCGNSMGGAIAAYCADRVRADARTRDRFVGAVLISPAVAVDPAAVPSAPVVLGLRALAWWAPAATLDALGLTPLEDPSHYECPRGSKRNYSGRWPLASSKMLLDVCLGVPADQAAGRLTMDCPLLVLCGDADDFIPAGALRRFVDAAAAPAADKELRVVAGGHALLCEARGEQLAGEVMAWLENVKR